MCLFRLFTHLLPANAILPAFFHLIVTLLSQCVRKKAPELSSILTSLTQCNILLFQGGFCNDSLPSGRPTNSTPQNFNTYPRINSLESMQPPQPASLKSSRVSAGTFTSRKTPIENFSLICRRIRLATSQSSYIGFSQC